MIFQILTALAVSSILAEGRRWNNTGVGSIIFEEAVSLPNLRPAPGTGNAPPGVTPAQLDANLADIHVQRLNYMDQAAVDYNSYSRLHFIPLKAALEPGMRIFPHPRFFFVVLSCCSPCIQGISDPVEAATLRVNANDDLAALISNNTMRFGAFAALSMHNATAAALELRRAVAQYGFLGALVNDYQQSGADNATLLYYDQPEYDVFWQAAVDLDVPVYFHPRTPISEVTALDYAHSPWLLGAPHQFAVELSNHVAGLCANGVFDRFPKLKVIVGHLGERIPSDFWRIDEMLSRKVGAGMPMNKTFSDYWKSNIYETTSGNFATDFLAFHTSLIGPSQILYSVDYPFVMMQQRAEWVTSLPLPENEKLRFIRGNAIELLGLDK